MLGWLCLWHVAVIDRPLKPGPKGCLLQRNHNKIWDSRIRAVGLSAMNLNQTKSFLPGPKTWQRCAKPQANEGIPNPNTQALWGQGDRGETCGVKYHCPASGISLETPGGTEEGNSGLETPHAHYSRPSLWPSSPGASHVQVERPLPFTSIL